MATGDRDSSRGVPFALRGDLENPLPWEPKGNENPPRTNGRWQGDAIVPSSVMVPRRGNEQREYFPCGERKETTESMRQTSRRSALKAYKSGPGNASTCRSMRRAIKILDFVAGLVFDKTKPEDREKRSSLIQGLLMTEHERKLVNAKHAEAKAKEENNVPVQAEVEAVPVD